jgi:TonB family protein
LIHFDFEDRYQDELVVGHAMSWRDGTFLSILVHVVVVLALMFGPSLVALIKSPEDLERERQQQLMEQARRDENRTFVFVQPRIDLKALEPPPRAELSDQDRKAQARERAENPTNPLPFSRGNSAERTESQQPAERARGPEAPPLPEPEPPKPEQQIARNLPPAETGLQRQVDPTRQQRPPGALGDALRNLQRYVQNVETFRNPQGGQNNPGSEIQFDTKGVEFGPWLRRFVAQVRRNWFVPYAAMTFRGRVVLQFNIHKNGTITDIVVVGPSDIDAFNRAASNAILGSNPTEPLPPEYPDEKAFFTVTFYYNQEPGS